MHLLGLLLMAPANHRSYYKPEGYPGDYEIIRMIHEGGFKGHTLIGKMLHKYTCSFPLATIARKRTEYLAGQIVRSINRGGTNRINVFSIASGPSQEIDFLMKKYPDACSRISLVLLDREIRALQFSKDNLYENKIRYGSDLAIDFMHMSLEEYIRQCAAGKKNAMYDLVYAFGIFDYFDKDVARFILKCFSRQIRKGGRFIISNISHDNNKYQTFLEYGLEWFVVYRSRDELAALAEQGAPGRKFSIEEIENGAMKFLIIEY
jgi:extracellular factor (EF) 3-hydroxypalmitic acid methyl ester biosynthesis protein